MNQLLAMRAHVVLNRSAEADAPCWRLAKSILRIGGFSEQKMKEICTYLQWYGTLAPLTSICLGKLRQSCNVTFLDLFLLVSGLSAHLVAGRPTLPKIRQLTQQVGRCINVAAIQTVQLEERRINLLRLIAAIAKHKAVTAEQKTQQKEQQKIMQKQKATIETQAATTSKLEGQVKEYEAATQEQNRTLEIYEEHYKKLKGKI